MKNLFDTYERAMRTSVCRYLRTLCKKRKKEIETTQHWTNPQRNSNRDVDSGIGCDATSLRCVIDSLWWFPGLLLPPFAPPPPWKSCKSWKSWKRSSPPLSLPPNLIQSSSKKRYRFWVEMLSRVAQGVKSACWGPSTIQHLFSIYSASIRWTALGFLTLQMFGY
jgi:hypothetical protein